MTDEGRPRGRRRRPMRMGGSGEGTVAEGDGDLRQDPNLTLNDAVRRRALEPAQEAEEGQEPLIDADDPEFTPEGRLKHVRSKASAYEREYRLKLLHRMLMRNVPLDHIARELDVSVSTVLRDRKELYSRLRDEAKQLDINELIGDSVGFYSEVQAMALRMASNNKLPIASRLAAMRTGLASKNDLHRFMNAAGVYDVLRYRASESNGSNEIEKLMSFTEKLLSGDDDLSMDEVIDDDLQQVRII